MTVLVAEQQDAPADLLHEAGPQIQEYVQALLSDKRFLRRIFRAIGHGGKFGKTAIKDAIKDEINIYLKGLSGLNSVARRRPLEADELQAIISLAAHTAVMAYAPGLGSITGSIAKFAAKRAYSSIAWRVLDFFSSKLSRRLVHEGLLFEGMVEAASGALEFGSSAAAEQFILEHPALRRAAAFSWWKGSGNRWGIAINRGGPSFQFVRQSHDGFQAGDAFLQ